MKNIRIISIAFQKDNGAELLSPSSLLRYILSLKPLSFSLDFKLGLCVCSSGRAVARCAKVSSLDIQFGSQLSYVNNLRKSWK